MYYCYDGVYADTSILILQTPNEGQIARLCYEHGNVVSVFNILRRLGSKTSPIIKARELLDSECEDKSALGWANSYDDMAELVDAIQWRIVSIVSYIYDNGLIMFYNYKSHSHFHTGFQVEWQDHSSTSERSQN